MRRIGHFDAELTRTHVGPDAMPLWRVAFLERHVDRAALLGALDVPEPPYWAHLWTGALVLAAAVPPAAGRVLELGCGLGLPGLVAARRGAHVTFVDRAADALTFVRASARANGLGHVDLVAADFTTPAVRGRFDLLLAAEVLYDRGAFAAVARTIRDHVAAGARALVTDAGRIDTRAFYDELAACDLSVRIGERAMREEGLPLIVKLVEISGTPS
jgi:predicted nicotinamide N-methyase